MKWLKSNLSIIVSVTIAGCLLFYAYGCEPKTKSLIDPTRKVTREEITQELDWLIATSKTAYTDLDKQIEVRNIIFQQGLLIAQGGAVNPVGVITTIMAVLGIGAATDDIRLRKKIKKESV